MSSKTFADCASSRVNNFNFFRFALATLVIQSHCYPMLGCALMEPVTRITRGQMGGGYLAVSCFFVISGFLVSGSWMGSTGLLRYLEKRVRRIYPGFAAALLFCVVIVGPLSRGGRDLAHYFASPSVVRFFRPLLMQAGDTLPGVFAHNPIPMSVNGSLWTLRYEFGCYLLVAALGMMGLFRRRGAVLALFIFVYALLNAECLGLFNPRFIAAREAPTFIVPYLAGVTFYLFRDRIPVSSRLAGVCALVIGVSCGLGGLTFVLPLCGTYLLFFLCFWPVGQLHLFGSRADISYGVYLYAYPVQQLLIQYYVKSLTATTLFLAAFPITCLLATLSWHFAEKPFLRRRASERPANNASRIAISVRETVPNLGSEPPFAELLATSGRSER